MRIFIRLVSLFLERLKHHHISAYASQAAYFIILSVIPFSMVLLSLIKFTPLSKDILSEILSTMIPSVFFPVFENILDELYMKATAVLSISAVMAVWSSAKGILALTNGFNIIYDVDETRNYILLRLRSAAYTVAFILTIVLSLALMVFGERINHVAKNYIPVIASVVEQIFDLRLIMAFLLQLLIFTLLFRFLPNRNISVRWQLPGALFASVGWNLFSFFFSIYVKYGHMSYMYGSLATLVIVMLWVYICMYIIFIGAEINAMVESLAFVQRREEKRREKKKQKKR